MKKTLRIAVSKGHNVFNSGVFDNGASGNGKKEALEVDKTVDELIPLLRKQGHTVVDITPKNRHFKNSKEAHQERARMVNEGNFDLYLDFHLNAGGGTGPEMWVYGPRGLSYDYARKMVTNIVEDTGLKNRGVKVKPGMWSLGMTNCPSIVVEGAFIDSKKDMEVITPKLYARSIARSFGTVEEKKSTDLIKMNLHGKDIEVEGIFKDKINHIPIRFLEKLGYKIGWKDNKVTIDYKGEDK